MSKYLNNLLNLDTQNLETAPCSTDNLRIITEALGLLIKDQQEHVDTHRKDGGILSCLEVSTAVITHEQETGGIGVMIGMTPSFPEIKELLDAPKFIITFLTAANPELHHELIARLVSTNILYSLLHDIKSDRSDDIAPIIDLLDSDIAYFADNLLTKAQEFDKCSKEMAQKYARRHSHAGIYHDFEKISKDHDKIKFSDIEKHALDYTDHTIKRFKVIHDYLETMHTELRKQGIDTIDVPLILTRAKTEHATGTSQKFLRGLCLGVQAVLPQESQDYLNNLKLQGATNDSSNQTGAEHGAPKPE